MEKEWELPESREVTVQELDEAVRALKKARDDYDLAKSVSTEKNAIVDECEEKLITLLGMAGKSNYEVDGVARVTVVTKSQVTTPKTIDEKQALFNWIENKMGKEALIAYQSINYATLNSLYNSEMSVAHSRGEEFNGIDGIGLPMVVKSLQVRAK